MHNHNIVHQKIITLTYQSYLLVAQRCAHFKHVVRNKAGAAESSAAYCRVFYNLAGCRTPPHSLATSSTRCRLGGRFARCNTTLTADELFTRSTKRTRETSLCTQLVKSIYPNCNQLFKTSTVKSIKIA